MAKKSKTKIEVQGAVIRIKQVDQADYISLTDIAKNNSKAEPASVIANWLRNQHTISFLEAWEETFSPDFKPSQMIGFRKFASDNRSLITTKKYIDLSGAVGIIAKSGRYGGTYAQGYCPRILLLAFTKIQGRFAENFPDLNGTGGRTKKL